jgi:hypothetical protein
MGTRGWNQGIIQRKGDHKTPIVSGRFFLPLRTVVAYGTVMVLCVVYTTATSYGGKM